jgi:membrane-associated phospholipid phosphatase
LVRFHGQVSVATEPVVSQIAPKPNARLTRRLLIGAAVTAVLAALVYLVLVHSVLGQRFDNAALLGAREQQPTTKATDVSMLQRISADSFAVVLAILVLLGLLRRRPRLGVGVALAAAIAVIATHVMRTSVLGRPLLVRSDAFYPSNTFPSGHTVTALACALALVVVSPPAWRGISAVLAGSYASFTAAAVQTAGWHRPSDAIGAAFLGFAAMAVVAAILAGWRPVGAGRRYAHLPAFALLGTAWLVAATLGAINAVRVLHFLANHADTFNPTPAILNNAYQFSVDLTIVVVVSLLGTLLILLGPYDLDEPARP